LYLKKITLSLPKFKTNNMTTTLTLTLHFDYENDDRENNIRGGWVLTDITNGNTPVYLSPKLEQLLNEELDPENF
jgi:hypothetical protein